MAVLIRPVARSQRGARASRPTTAGLPAELVPVALLPFVLLVATAGLWPLWHRQPVLAGVTTFVVTALVTTGLVLLAEPAQRGIGAGLVAAGVLLEVSWSNEWGSGPLPLISLLEGHGWIFLVGWALYRFPRRVLLPRERRAFRLMTVWVLVWPWAWILTSRPNWREYPADAWWPAIRPDRTLHSIATWAVDVSAIAVLALYVSLWIRRMRSDPARQRAATLPAAVAAVIGAGCASLAPFADAARLPLRLVDLMDTVATLGVLAIPGALMVAVARRQLARARLTALVMELRGADSADAAVAALRRALDDETLTIGQWSGDGTLAYRDAAGRPVDIPEDDAHVVATVTSSTGAPLAVVVGDAGVHTDGELFAAACTAFGFSLENARLLETARKNLDDLYVAKSQALTAAQSERRRLEQDLHDGAQARFLALAPLIGAAQSRTPDRATSDALDEIKAELQDALAELRRLARGADGVESTHRTLAEAVAGLARGSSIPVTVDLPDGPLPDTVERTAYFVICEALVNATRHADARGVTVSGRITGDRFTVVVTDDGRGGAADGPGRGLPGMRDRAREAGGLLSLASPPGGGTTVTLDLPCG